MGRRALGQERDVLRRVPRDPQRLHEREPRAALGRDPERRPLQGATTSTSRIPSRSRNGSRTPGTSTRDESKGLHPFDGVTDPNFVLGKDTKGTRTNIENIDENAEVLLGQVAALEGQCGRSRPAGPLHRRLRARPQGHQGAGRRRAEGARRADHGAVLDARPHRGARARVPVGGAQDEALLRRADRQHQGRRPRDRQHREMGTVDWPAEAKGAGPAKPRAARSRTGSRSRTRRSTSTSAWCPRRGTRGRATPRARSARTRPRCSTRRWRSPSSRSRSCARSTASTRASPARRT